MPEEHRLTTSSDETELSKLLDGEKIFSIPYFQRAYKWKLDKLRQLETDLLNVVDAEDSHFLGAMIIYGRSTAPAEPDVYEVIDGQQRMTTVFLYICAIVRALCKKDLYEEAEGLFLKYLVIGRATRLVSNSKLHCCKEDRAQLNRVFGNLVSDPAFAKRLGAFRYKPLSATGEDKGRLWSNYLAAQRFLDEQVRLEGVERLQALYGALLKSMTLVQIVVKNPTDGPKIFDSLNSRQEPMTTGDLVRNEIFSKVANEHPDTIEAIDQRSWQPFYSRFRQGSISLFDAYFFPYGLIQDPNIRKSDVYEKLRTQWKGIDDPEDIVRRLSVYQGAFLDAARGTNSQGHAQDVCSAFSRLHQAGAPSSTYPFLMQFSNAVRDGDVDADEAVAVLSLIESFLVRRAICGHEPTGLHAVFKRLWVDCDGSPTAGKVQTKIRGHRTVAWPSAEDVQSAVSTRALYATSIAAYLLIEWNRKVGGDQPVTAPWIEHVLPDKPVEQWFKVFTREQHARMKDLLANLLPLSEEMNRNLSNGPYSAKQPKYRDDSGFKAARNFAEEHDDWTPAALEARSTALAAWAVERWPS